MRERGTKKVNFDLHVCLECQSELVYPVTWNTAGEGWEVELRCPNCEWGVRGWFSHTVIEHFDDTLNRGTDKLIDELETFSKRNREEWIESFARALEHDYILPEDF